MRQTFIYVLCDPDTGDVRYVGKTDRPGRRLKLHLAPSALKIRCRRTSWLRGLLNQGKQPVLTVIETVDVESWKERECFWIAFYRGLGCNLVNTAEGGTGGVKSEWIAEQTREKMRRAQLGKKRSEESRRKQGEALKGKKRSPEIVAKMSAAHKGKRPSQACLDAQRKAVTGVTPPPEVIAKRTAHSAGNEYACTRRFIATDQDGNEYEVKNMSAFCREHGLHPAHMGKLAAGDPRRRQHKGWTCRYAE